ncbi:hypothetical protein CPC16_005710 [Podila verticillata]|nr:hypothetical protein CPC16_005710 [Podila verticillata]
MKIVSLTTLTATSLVSAGKFISLSEKSTSVVQGAYIIDEDGTDDTKAGNSLDSHNVDYKISREFYVFNGASCDVRSGHNSEDLAMIPGVKRIPTFGKLYGPHTMIGVDYVHKTLKYTGKRIEVGNLDTALTSPSPPSADALAKDVAAGMEPAFNQGMSVTDMSLGGGYDHKTNSIAALADRLAAHGMAVVAAAGNDGNDGVGMVSDAGLGDLSTSYFKYADKVHPYLPFARWNKAVNLPSSAIFPLLEADGSLKDGCDASYPTVVRGKIALVLGDFNSCSWCRWMLIQSLPYGFVGLTGTAFPMVSISEVRIKPDISAPGGNVYSTFPVNMGRYAIESGCWIDQCQNVIKVKTSISPEHIQLLDTVHFTSKLVDVKINNLFGANRVTIKASQAKVEVKVQFSQPATGKAEQPLDPGYIIAIPNGKDPVSVRIPMPVSRRHCQGAYHGFGLGLSDLPTQRRGGSTGEKVGFSVDRSMSV